MKEINLSNKDVESNVQEIIRDIYLDNWVPENETGHSRVCRIHKAAMASR